MQVRPREAGGLPKKEDTGPDKLQSFEENSYEEELQVYSNLKFFKFPDILCLYHVVQLCPFKKKVVQ